MGQPYINAQPVDNLWTLPALITPEVPPDLHRCRLGPAIGEHVLTTVDRVTCAGHVGRGRGEGSTAGCLINS